MVLGFLLGAFVGAAPEASAQNSRDQTSDRQGVFINPYSPAPLLFNVPPHSPEDVMAPEDEMAYTRAVLLLRAGRLEEASAEFERLGEIYPWSRRVASLRARVVIRQGDPKRALRILDEGAKAQEAKFREHDPAFTPERFAPERADAYLALDDANKAIPWMIEAVDQRGASSEKLHEKLLDWAGDDKLGARVAREAKRQHEAAPERVSLALISAELAAVAGNWDDAWAQLDRTEALAFEEARGDLHRAVARRLTSQRAVPAATDARAWYQLTVRAPRDETRFEAFRVLLDPTAVPAKPPATGPRAAELPTDDLVVAWEGLPAGPEREMYGLYLARHLRDRGAGEAADVVADQIREEGLPPDLRGSARLEQGLARIRDGELETGLTLIEQAAGEATGAETRARALYALGEARYYAQDFDSAHTLFSEFVRLYPKEKETNDALERLYLLEGGGTPTGAVASQALREIAVGEYAAARGDWAQAAERAQAARQIAGAGEDDARAQAALLLSRAEAQRGDVDAAVNAALWVADSLFEHRLAPVARRQAADLLLSAGRAVEALAQYEELLARHPDSWVAPEVRRRVMDLRAGNAQ
jgi:tetratricopeptide (TPR) repeat protein